MFFVSVRSCVSMANILLTIDVEDWFQVENFKENIPFSSWSSRELRVEKNTHRLLNLFDSVDFKRSPLPAGSTLCSDQHPVSRIQYLDSSIQYLESSF